MVGAKVASDDVDAVVCDGVFLRCVVGEILESAGGSGGSKDLGTPFTDSGGGYEVRHGGRDGGAR